ncbi:hypothetical protein ACFQ4X_15480 [Fictibacillus halophilus]|uniref:hypothetical protein n=1 Tax=Fictibacillus halophilus TaxID=1610490 RepID=UPI0036323281
MRAPEVFNSNEWFIILVCIFLIIVATVLKRKISYSQIAVIFTLNFFLAASLDHILAGPPYDLYDIMDIPDFEVFDFAIYIFIYPLSGYLFVYVFEISDKKGFPAFFYLLVSSLITLGLEWISNQFHVFKHNEWTYFHSFAAYFFVYSVNLGVYFWMKRINTTCGQNDDVKG